MQPLEGCPEGLAGACSRGDATRLSYATPSGLGRNGLGRCLQGRCHLAIVCNPFRVVRKSWRGVFQGRCPLAIVCNPFRVVRKILAGACSRGVALGLSCATLQGWWRGARVGTEVALGGGVTVGLVVPLGWRLCGVGTQVGVPGWLVVYEITHMGDITRITRFLQSPHQAWEGRPSAVGLEESLKIC